jgi:DNA polymerase-3 subunit beta
MQIDTIETAGAEVARAEFSADAKALADAVAYLEKRAIDPRGTVPILACIHVAADLAGTVTLTATDCDLRASVTIAADVRAPGQFCTEAGPLADTLAKAKKEKGRELYLIENEGRLVIKAGRSRWSLKLGAVADFLVRLGTPTDEGPLSGFTVPAAQFVQDLAALEPCQSKEESRDYLRGVMIEARELAGRERLVMVATDGSNIAAASRPAPEGLEPFGQAILSSRTVAALIAAGKLASDADAVQVEPGARFAFTVGAVRIEAKLIAGTFPEWERVFAAGNLTPTDGDACLFPDLLPGAPVAALEKLAKGVKGAIDWQPATRGLIGTLPGDDGLIFGAMALAGAGCDKKDMAYQWTGQDDARAYLLALAESAGLVTPATMAARCAAINAEWKAKDALLDKGAVSKPYGSRCVQFGRADCDGAKLVQRGGEVLGLTISGEVWRTSWSETVQDWETLIEREIHRAGSVEPIEGGYSIVMPRERAQLEPESFIDGPDGHRYAVAMGDKAIAFSKEQVRALMGEGCFAVMAVTLPNGKPANILQWLWDQGDTRFLTVRPDGRCYGAKAAPVYVTRAEIEAGPVQGEPEASPLDDAAASKAWLQSALKGHFSQAEAEMPEAVAVERPEICPETVQGSESEPVAGEGEGEAVADALGGPEIEPVELSDFVEQLPADPVMEQSHDQIDPMAELAARVAALEAMAATPLPAVSTAPPSGEAARAKRTPAHERAVRRAWMNNRLKWRMVHSMNAAGECEYQQRDMRRSAVRRAWAERAKRREAMACAERMAVEAKAQHKRADDAEGQTQRMAAKRARSTLLARRRGAEMSLMAKMAKNLHAKLQVAQTTPVYASDSGRESADLVGHAMSVAFEQRERAEAAESSIGASRAAVGRQQEAIERMADAMEAATLRAIRAETALAARDARANGWPPAVRSVSVNFAA